MKTKRQRKRSEQGRASAVDRAERQKSGVKPYLDLPSNTKIFLFDKEGTKKIDIIEYRAGKGNPNAKKGDLYFERTFFVHRNIGPDNDSHICLAKTFKKACPVCEYRAKLARRPDADDDETDALKPSERQLFRVVDPRRKKEGIKLLDISNFFFGKELDAALRKQKKKLGKDVVDKFASPDEGMTVKCEIEEDSYKGRATFKTKLVKLVERDEQYDEDLVDEGPNLDDILKPMPYDKLKELFDQSADDDDEDEDDDDDDTDDDDESEDEDDDDEDDEESDDSDDEDEDADDEDDDEDDDDSEDDEDDEDLDEDDVSKGDMVTFTYKGKKRRGKVRRIKDGLCHVKCEGRSDPYAVPPEDCTVVDEDEDEEDDDDEAFDEDEDEEEEKPRKKKKRK
jgi:hypothetical protein